MSDSLKHRWLHERAEKLEEGPTTMLIRLAEDHNIPIDDSTVVSSLAMRIAELEWKGKRLAIDYPPADVTGVPWDKDDEDPFGMALPYSFVAHGDEFNAMESGPQSGQPQTASGHFIQEVLLPEFLERFFAKNADYGDQHRAGLGVAAEYVGIHRKVEKLKKALWDGQTMNGEDAREMLFDLIGQCFIVLDLLAQPQT